jgi:osmotically-inducible protein OsmY
MIDFVDPAPPVSHRITALAEARLRASQYSSIRKIFCMFDEGMLVLRGRLPSFFHKQLAQTAVADIQGVTQIVNQIEVLD